MIQLRTTLLIVLSLVITASAKDPWQEITMPTAAEVLSNFRDPPPEYHMTLWWGWNGPMTKEVIQRDLDGFYARGVRVVTIEPGYNMNNAPYLSPAWFELIRFAVEEARRRGMRIWLVDEGKYPSGFAGGSFTSKRPDLRMQALVIADRIPVDSGKALSRKLSPAIVGALAVNQENQTSQVLDISSGELQWRPSEGKWEVLLIEHQFRSSPTRSVNNPTRGKDDKASLCDYLNPAATKQFLEFTHAQYEKYVGSEFGKTILGFRGDEPDYSIRGIPWTPAIFTEFERRKGYDVRPYISSFFAPQLSDTAKRAKADYWDVWSDLFRDHFFRVQAEWCARRQLAYLVHLNHEDQGMALVRSEGDFFKDMRYVQVPGIDAIWNQIWPGKVADFPKYASSAAHLFGRPRSFTESFAAYRQAPNAEQAKWVIDFQFARGINLIEVMFAASSASSGRFNLRGWMASEEFPRIVSYVGRASYLLSQGQPAAQIGVYIPTSSMWLGDEKANKDMLAIAQELLERQRDFDFVDEQALSSVLKLEKGAFRSLSGNEYRTILVPGASVISRAVLRRLQEFAKNGGHIVFIGKLPALAIDSSFLKATKPGNLDWATFEPAIQLTQQVMNALPPPDVTLDSPMPTVKYVHRRWRDSDMYFFFNESDQSQKSSASLMGAGQVEVWDTMTGQTSRLTSASTANQKIQIPLDLQPHESKLVVIRGTP